MSIKDSFKSGFGGCLGVVIAVILVIVVLAFIGRGKSSSTPRSTSSSGSNTAQEDTGKVEVKSHSESLYYGYHKVVGEVVNNTKSDASSVKVSATFYDKDGKVVSTADTYISETISSPLKPGLTAPFAITDLSQKNFDHYKLDVSWN